MIDWNVSLFVQDRSPEELYQAFKSRLLEETDLRMWPNRHLDCQGVTGDKGKTEPFLYRYGDKTTETDLVEDGDMTAQEIISKHILNIHGIRIPYAQIIVANIMVDLKDAGYKIVDETDSLPSENRQHLKGETP